MAAHCSGCVFTVCVCVHWCVCVHFGWVKRRAQIPSMGHHTWLYIMSLSLFFTFSLLQYLSPQPDTNDSISSGFDEGPPSEKRNVLWLISCPSALWLANSLDGITVPPLAKTASSSILPYQFRPREYWGSHRIFACTDIARHIKVVMLLLLFLFFCTIGCQQQLLYSWN